MSPSHLEIGSYKIESQLGEGGMGVVFKALDTKLNRPVAVKLLSDKLADAAARRRFQREAQTASSLNHPHILTVYDAGEFEGRQYLVTEYIDGGTLYEWTESANRTWREIVELLTGVADGLATAHEAKILHRDIKPANILVMKSGYAKLGDFGLAKLAEESLGATTEAKTLIESLPEQTRTGAVVGTVVYMSPEQAQGKPIDARSDIFSFGVVLYELLARRRPFDGRNNLETLQKVIHEVPPPLSEDVPTALRALVEKALKKDPAERYQNMREIVADLRSLTRVSDVQAVSTAAPPIPVAPKPESKRARRYLMAVAVLLLIVAVGTWYLLAPKSPVTNPSEFVQLTNFSDYATAPAISPDGTMVAFFRAGDYFLGTGQVYVKLLSSGESKLLTNDPSRKYDPVFTPDGSRVAYSIQNAKTQTWDTWTVPVLGGSPSRLMQNAAGLSWFGPDRIVFSKIMDGTAIHMGVATARENRAEEHEIYFPSHERAMAHYSYPSPDRRSLLLVEMDRIPSWQRCRLLPMDGSSAGEQVGPQGACLQAGWSPDEKWMYFNAQVDGATHLWRQRFPKGTSEQITFGPAEEEGLAVAPDGKSLITSIGARQSSVWLKDAMGERRLPVEGSASQPMFSADGTRLYYLVKKASSTETIELWVTDIASGRADSVLTGQSIVEYDISPDQKNVAFTVRNGGASTIFMAAMDRASAPRLITKDGDFPSFLGATDLLFRQLGEKASYLARIHTDGTGLARVMETPIVGKGGSSPDGEWATASGLIDPSKPGGTYAISLKDGSHRPLCIGGCDVKWSLDGKILFLSVLTSAFGPGNSKNTLSNAGRTIVIPLPRGFKEAGIPAAGFNPAEDEELVGIRIIRQEQLAPGFDANTYAYSTAEFQGNLFRIPLH